MRACFFLHGFCFIFIEFFFFDIIIERLRRDARSLCFFVRKIGVFVK